MSAGLLIGANMRYRSAATSHTDPFFVDSRIHKLEDLCARRYFTSGQRILTSSLHFLDHLLAHLRHSGRFDPEIQWPECGSCRCSYIFSSAYTVVAVSWRSAFYFHCAISQKSTAHTWKVVS